MNSAYTIKPKKSLGQHFLINPAICQRIVRLLEPNENDQILEIGPGPGALTSLLLGLPHKNLLLLEKDSHLAAQYAQKSGCAVINGDALQFDWAALTGTWKLVGNLPYNVASPLIWDIVSQCPAWQNAVLMVQKEVGERICALPGSRKYGALSVWIQCHARVKYEFSVGPGNFRPPPKVDSAVISLQPLACRPPCPAALNDLLKICFQKRRKQLGSIFSPDRYKALANALSVLKIDPKLRPENLTCANYLDLARIWAQHVEFLQI